MEYRISGVAAEPTRDGRATIHRLANGSTLALVHPPLRNGSPSSETNGVAGLLQPVMEKVGEAQAVERAVMSDKNLSEHGKAEKLKASREAAQRALSEATRLFNQRTESTVTLTEQAYAAPKIETDDIEAPGIDREIRDYVRGLSSKELTEYLATLPKNQRHLLAMKRSPVPIPIATEYAEKVWRASKENTAEVIRLNKVIEANEWMGTVLRAFNGKI